jgi:hypothetical protein
MTEALCRQRQRHRAKRHRTGELISCPELGEVRTPIKALGNPDTRPPLTDSRRSASGLVCNGATSSRWRAGPDILPSILMR